MSCSEKSSIYDGHTQHRHAYRTHKFAVKSRKQFQDVWMPLKQSGIATPPPMDLHTWTMSRPYQRLLFLLDRAVFHCLLLHPSPLGLLW